MALTTTIVLEICDRLAKQIQYYQEAATNSNADDGDDRKFYLDVSQSDDYDFENTLITAANSVDTNNTIAGVMGWLTRHRALVTALNTYFSGQSTTLDAYLTANSIQVSEYFDDIWNSVKSSHLSAANVFCEQTVDLGDVEIEAGPVCTFTDSERIGTGTGSAGGSGATRNYAPARVKAVVQSGFGATDLDLTLTLTVPAGTSETKDITIPAGSVANTEVEVGDSGDVYINLTDVAFTDSGDEGTVGDTVEFRHIKTRTIAL